jgi:hypothetical protein
MPQLSWPNKTIALNWLLLVGDKVGAEGGGDPHQGHRVRRQGDRLQERLWLQRALPCRG